MSAARQIARGVGVVIAAAFAVGLASIGVAALLRGDLVGAAACWWGAICWCAIAATIVWLRRR